MKVDRITKKLIKLTSDHSDSQENALQKRFHCLNRWITLWGSKRDLCSKISCILMPWSTSNNEQLDLTGRKIPPEAQHDVKHPHKKSKSRPPTRQRRAFAQTVALIPKTQPINTCINH